jgi:hypothetical protein
MSPKPYNAMYENEQRYETEFAHNLSECKSAFASQFGDNKNEVVSVAAPGKINAPLENIAFRRNIIS